MANVIGPIEFSDWYEMRQLYSSISWMKKTNAAFYSDGIEHETELYSILRSKYLGT